MEQAKALALSFLRTFVAAAIGAMLMFGGSPLDMAAEDWKVVLAAGITAVLKVAYNALNPKYTGYGVGAAAAAEEARQDAADAYIKAANAE